MPSPPKNRPSWTPYTKNAPSDGRPTAWGPFVAGLQEPCWLTTAGITIEVDGRQLNSAGNSYTWSHERYHMLEDGYDDWIGSD